MLDERKAAILRAVVEEYIRTAQPVGSAHVAGKSELAVSSATVRNEMGVLEREGYLAQPHTSAGRIPTDKGYRFFVDSIAKPGALQPAQTAQVRDFFARAHGEIEQMLHDTSRLLANLTDYAAVVVAPHLSEAASIRSVQLVELGPHSGLLVAVLSTGAVEKWPIELPAETSHAQLNAATAHLNAHVVGCSLGDSLRVPATGDATVDRLTERALRQFSGAAPDGEQVFVGGAARMAEAFDAVGTIRQVLTILEQQFVLVSLLRDVLDRGLSVAIGTEHGVQLLADCSVVVAPYVVDGEALGTVGVLGPTRMHYDQAMAAVAVVSKRLGKALTEG
jgi:heat-inducible transcriptional repressor